MNTHDNSIKFTDGLEREWIQRENAGMDSLESVAPLVQWAVAVALAAGSLFLIVVHGSHGTF